ncbi:MAG: hypothetical protein ACR5LD_07390 [Symbiopectobacterium sp.]
MAQLGQSIPRMIQLKRKPEASEASLSLPSGSPFSPPSDALCTAPGVVAYAEIVVVLYFSAQQLHRHDYCSAHGAGSKHCHHDCGECGHGESSDENASCSSI